MVNVLLIAGGVFGFIFVAVIGILIWFKIKGVGNKKFAFLLYSRDGTHKTPIEGRVTIDPTNKSNKRFAFNTSDSTLEIRNPTLGEYREITYNQFGEYVYLNKSYKVDDKGNLAVSLEPEEKQIALHRLKENQKRFDDKINKQQAYMMLAGFMLILIIVLGVVYSTIAYVNASKDMVKLAKSSTDIAESNEVVAGSNQLIAEQLASIAAALTGDANITRRIT